MQWRSHRGSKGRQRPPYRLTHPCDSFRFNEFFLLGGGHCDGGQFLLAEAVVVVKIEDYTSVLYVYMHLPAFHLSG